MTGRALYEISFVDLGPHLGAGIAMMVVLVGISGAASAEVPLEERHIWEGTLDYFMTGVNLAEDTTGNNMVDSSAQPASFEVTSQDIHADTQVASAASLESGFLYLGGKKLSNDGQCSAIPDDEVELTLPSGTVLNVVADVCHCAESGAMSYDTIICRSELTTEMINDGGEMIGTYTVDGYDGVWNNGATDNASAALVVVFSEPAIALRRVLLYDRAYTMYNSAQTLTLTGLNVGSTASDT